MAVLVRGSSVEFGTGLSPGCESPDREPPAALPADGEGPPRDRGRGVPPEFRLTLPELPGPSQQPLEEVSLADVLVVVGER